MTRCNRCDAEWTSKKWEHCRSCDQTFASTRAGDAHRAGHHDEYPPSPLARRCLGPAEMEAKGLWSTESASGVLVWHGEPSKTGVARRREVVP